LNHIVFIIPGLNRISGAERQLILLAHGLKLRGWRVSVVALSGTGGSAAADLASAGIAFLTLEMRKGLADPRGWIRFHRWLRKESPDVIHAHLPHAVWLARWSRLAAPVRVLVDTLHSSNTGSIGRRIGYRFSNWLPDEVTAVSHAAANAHLASKMARPITVLPNGIDTNIWRPDPAVRASLRNQLSLLHKEFIWLAAGRLDPVKDYPTLLSALAQLPPTSRLVIAGAGPCESQLRQQSTALGLNSRVRFLGFEPNVLRWMQAADAFVLSSRWEGLPMALLEAAACGLPAVATNVPGTREAIEEGRTAWLVAPGKPLLLAESMLRLMQTPKEAQQTMGTHARQQVLDHFSLESVLDRWEALYHRLLLSHPEPARRRKPGQASRPQTSTSA
jgi:glycosyltransferase involved in cell wall biosynthesis